MNKHLVVVGLVVSTAIVGCATSSAPEDDARDAVADGR
jgi:hypothetical protein